MTSPPPDPAPDGAAQPAEEPTPSRRPSAAVRTVLLGFAVVAAVLAGALVAGGLLEGGQTVQPPPSANGQQGLQPVSRPEDTPLPDATLDAFPGREPVSTTDYRGAPLVLNFWATWCTPCVVEMPDFEEVSNELEGQVAFLGVNAQDRADAAARFVEELGITYDLASDPRGEYFEEVGGFGWPTTLLVDADGRIRYRHTGPLEADRLRALLAEHLGVGAPT